ncbi:glycosyltransferase family 4 protein, partial [uncultured Jatrophihabitans sp.]|uniref:glycosyltransferase family 4 protein n=1 Tax=uncultured Jatrophihabitans sp. TaxID=1610747 RepID=UPI0035CB4181
GQLPQSGGIPRYGPTARLGGVARPFALPVLREETAASRVLASAVDARAGRKHRARLDRPRVVYLDHIAQLSGGEIALARMLAALPDVDAHVILGADGPLRAQLERAGAEVEVIELDAGARDTRRDVAVGAGGLRAAAALTGHTARLARRLRQLRPDVVHSNSLKSGYYGAAAARIAGVPLVWHLRDRLVDDYLPARAISATRALLHSAPAAVLCPSREVASHVGGPAAVVPDPYAASRPPREPTESLRTIGVVGRISPWKGQDVALRALAHLPDLRLRVIGSPIFGEDDYLQQLRDLAAELGVADRVDFVGFVDDVEDELRRLDALVHASTVAEPFGQVVVEGLAAGVPVIATDAGGPREIVTDHVDGLLVAPGDADAMAGALRELAGDAALRAQLAENGVRRATAFAPDVIGAQVQALYREILGY